MESLFPWNQTSRRWRSSFRAPFNIISYFDLEHRRLVSPTHIETKELFSAWSKSLMCIRNKNGPRRISWTLGAPQLQLPQSILDSVPFSLQNCLLFLRYDLNQGSWRSFAPQCSNFWLWMSLSTVLNAFLRSIDTSSFTSPLPIASYQTSHFLVSKS